MEDLDAKSSPFQKKPADLLVGGEGREGPRNALMECLEKKYK